MAKGTTPAKHQQQQQQSIQFVRKPEGYSDMYTRMYGLDPANKEVTQAEVDHLLLVNSTVLSDINDADFVIPESDADTMRALLDAAGTRMDQLRFPENNPTNTASYPTHTTEVDTTNITADVANSDDLAIVNTMESKAATISAAWRSREALGFAMSKQAQLVRSFAVKQPVNTSGILTEIITPSGLANLIGEYATVLGGIAEDIAAYPEQEVLMRKVPVEYLDGVFLVEGLAFFDKLPGEPYDCYKVFAMYRDMILTENRRNFAFLSRATGETLATINTLRYVYYWDYRVKAFDQYRLAHKAINRAKQQEKLMDQHITMSSKLLQIGMEYIENNTEALDPKTALNLISFAFESARISAGLLKDKPGAPGTTDGSGTSISFTHTTNHGQIGSNQNNSIGSGVGASSKSEVQVRLEADMKDDNTLLSVLNILCTAGALDSAIDPNGEAREEKETVTIEAEYEELRDVDLTPHRLNAVDAEIILTTASETHEVIADLGINTVNSLEQAVKGGKV